MRVPSPGQAGLGQVNPIPYTEVSQPGTSLIRRSLRERPKNSTSPNPGGSRDDETIARRRGLAAEGGGLKASCRAPGLARRARVSCPDRAGLGEVDPAPYTEVSGGDLCIREVPPGTSLIQRSPPGRARESTSPHPGAALEKFPNHEMVWNFSTRRTL